MTTPPDGAAPAFDPSKPLQADATDQEMNQRESWLYAHNTPRVGEPSTVIGQVAREFAHAQVRAALTALAEDAGQWTKGFGLNGPTIRECVEHWRDQHYPAGTATTEGT